MGLWPNACESPMDGLTHLANHLVLPAWWVRAHDAAGRTDARGEGAMSQAVTGRLSPALSSVELTALALVLSQLQAGTLAGPAATLRVSLGDHLKHAGQSLRARRFAYERVLQELSALRVVLADGSPVRWRTELIFCGEFWQVEDDDLIVELTPTTLGHELLIGICDQHVELQRRVQGLTEAQSALGREAPLTVWRSVWLDLAGPELELFLRIERAMQWDQRWLDLDGSFAVPFSLLMGELGRRVDFGAKLRQLARLGRRLISHGHLAVPRLDGRYLAFGNEGQEDFLVVWQVGRERRASDAVRRHILAAARWNLRERLQPQAEVLANLLLPSDVGAGAAATLAREVLGLPAPDDAVVALWDGGSSLLSPQMLFLEFALRMRAHGGFALPESVTEAPFVALADPAATESTGMRFERFCAALVGEPEFARNLRIVPLATLASEASRDLAPSIRKKTDLLTISAPQPGRTEVKPRLVPVGTAVSTPAPEKVAEKQAHADPDYFASRMRKTAADELARLRAGDPVKYSELKKAYFDSLDEGARRMLYDVQRQLEPTRFEEQLRPQLVRFMMEHPGAWKSSTPIQNRVPAGPKP